MFFYITLFLISIFILTWLAPRLIKTLINVAKYFGLREFIVAFFVMAMAGSLPNLFIDIGAALRGFPELAFGDILGGNLVDLTLIMALAIFMTKKGSIPVESKMIQQSAIFTAVIAIMPMLLILDMKLDRIDGAILILAFFIYAFWLFSRGDRFKKIYKSEQQPIKKFSNFFKDLIKIIIFLIILLVISQIIINSAQYFSNKLGISLALVGLLIVGLGNCFPEAYFSIVSARRGESYMILGDIMGSVISCTTLVLGIVAIIVPFEIDDFSPFLIARIFLIVTLVVFLVAIRTGKKITKKEAIILLFIYIIFLLVEIFKPVIF